MGVELEQALANVQDAAAELFDLDATIRSVGVGQNGEGFGFVAIRNVKAPVAFAARVVAGGPVGFPERLQGIPIRYQNSVADPSSLVRVPHSGPGSPMVGSLVPEQQLQRPLVCGLQLQNFDNDVRAGEIANGFMTVGTLGCFVELPNQITALLSNNHVVAGENHGIKGHDRIVQPGGVAFNQTELAATLTDFVTLQTSPRGASIAAGTVTLNDIDAGIAEIVTGQPWSQTYLPSRIAAPPKGVAVASIGDKVHKVGRTTGLQFGEVKQVGVVVGPVGYGIGECWFRQSIVVEGVAGTTFSDHGDSGSAIVRTSDGMVVGLLYAGNGSQTYACPINAVLSAFSCRLV